MRHWSPTCRVNGTLGRLQCRAAGGHRAGFDQLRKRLNSPCAPVCRISKNSTDAGMLSTRVARACWTFSELMRVSITCAPDLPVSLELARIGERFSLVYTFSGVRFLR